MKTLAAMSLLFAVLAFQGCATTSPQTLASIRALPDEAPPIGADPAECSAQWDRAQLWVAKHARWKIQTATNVLIETYNPQSGSITYGFEVQREPAPGGLYTIRMSMVCGNDFHKCQPLPDDVRRAFYHYVRTGEDVLLGGGGLEHSSIH